jgi:matrixin
MRPLGRCAAGAARLLGAALVASLAATGVGRAFVPLRFVSPELPPATWPLNRIPLATVIHPSGSADVTGTADILAVQAAQQTWGAVNTSYFFFATATVSSAAAINDGDGINSILWDETGALFPPGDTTLATTILRVDVSTDTLLDADTVFNGVANTWSVATPTPVGRCDIRAVATHEMGHTAGLDHNPILSSALYPHLSPASQEARILSIDDRRGIAVLYAESSQWADFRAPSTGEGDLSQAMGGIAGHVWTGGASPVHGSQILAFDSAGSLAAGVLSAADGSYLLPGLPKGIYQVAAAELDGPVGEADLANGRADNFLTGYPAAFSGGNEAPAWRGVSPGAVTQGVDLTVARSDQPEAEPNGTSGEASGLVPAVPRDGTIGFPGDADYYSFPAQAGEMLLLDVDAGKDGDPLDPILTLFDPSGVLPLASVDDTPGKGLDPRIARRFGTAGTYFARVTHAFSEGNAGYSYSIALARCEPETEPNGTKNSALMIVPADRRGGVLDGAGDLDFYAFAAAAGERLHAEVTAERSGSPLDSKLTLLASDGISILTQSSDTFGKDPALDYTVPASQSPGTLYLKLEPQAGAGTGSWYCLAFDEAALRVSASAKRTLGAGVTGALLDPYPRSAVPGESFDLVLAGYGLRPEVTAMTTENFVSITGTTGPSFMVDAQGRGVKAFSVFVSSQALPGAFTFRVKDGSGRESILPGGLVIQAVAPPGEVAATAATPLSWIGNEMFWTPVPGATGYDLIRGNLASLIDLDANGLSDSYGSALACAISDPIAYDPGNPPAGTGYFYLVAARNGYGVGNLGNASNGLARPPSAITPACP